MNRFSSWMSVIALLAICSCGEKDVQPFVTFPSAYHKVGIDRNNDYLRVFASSGEITSKYIINQFLARDSSTFSYLDKYYGSAADFMDSVEFLDSHNAAVRIYFQHKMNCDISLEDDGLIILTQYDAASWCCYYDDVFTRTLYYNLIKVKPDVQYEYIYSSTRGLYEFGYVGKQKFVFVKHNNTLVAPFAKFMIHTEYPPPDRYGNNILHPDFYKNLAKGDTLVYMVSYLRYEINR